MQGIKGMEKFLGGLFPAMIDISINKHRSDIFCKSLRCMGTDGIDQIVRKFFSETYNT
jgi:hypothetical protein